MSIGKNIYELRKDSKMTQNQLAEMLGVSSQSVSKWENDICAPDVSVFPTLAKIFGVSIDRLYGFNLDIYDEEVDAIIRAADESQGTYSEIEILTEGLRKFPNNSRLKLELVFSLFIVIRMGDTEEERSAAKEKAIRLCNEVIASCGDSRLVDSAFHMLSRIYNESNEPDKAMEAAEKISADDYFLRIAELSRSLVLKNDMEALGEFTQRNLFYLWLCMDSVLKTYTESLKEAGEEEKALDFLLLHGRILELFDDGCHDFYVCHKFFNCESLARIYMNRDEKEKCLEQIRKLKEITDMIKYVENVGEYHVSHRNGKYFSCLNESEAVEEYMCGRLPLILLKGYDKYFGSDAEYCKLRAAMTENNGGNKY